MMNELTKQIIADACYIGVTTIAGIASYYFKKFVDSKKELIEKQKEALKQQIGDAQYQKDLSTAQRIVMAVEQMGKEYDWEGAIKHSKATEIISQKTGLSSGDIFEIIKATVAELNADKDSSKVAEVPTNTEAPNNGGTTPGASA